jgi:hypothetical protein
MIAAFGYLADASAAIDLSTASRPLIEINEPEVSAPMLSVADRGACLALSHGDDAECSSG